MLYPLSYGGFAPTIAGEAGANKSFVEWTRDAPGMFPRMTQSSTRAYANKSAQFPQSVRRMYCRAVGTSTSVTTSTFGLR